MPVMNIATFNDSHELPLLQRPDNGFGAIPGGFMEVGETFAYAAIRELFEDPGAQAETLGIVGLHSDLGHVTDFGDGTAHQQCATRLSAQVGDDISILTPEGTEVRFRDDFSTVPITVHATMRLRTRHAFAPEAGPMWVDGGQAPRRGPAAQ